MTNANEDRERKVTEILQLLRSLEKLQPVDLSSPSAVRKRWNDYIDACTSYNVLPSWAGVAAALGHTEDELARAENGEIPRIRQLITASTTAGMNAKIISDASGIFRLKNESGYKDARETLMLGEVMHTTEEELLKRYDSIEALNVAVEQPNGSRRKRSTRSTRRNLPSG